MYCFVCPRGSHYLSGISDGDGGLVAVSADDRAEQQISGRPRPADSTDAGSKEPMQFDKEYLAVLRVNLGNAVVQTVAGTGLEKLKR